MTKKKVVVEPEKSIDQKVAELETGQGKIKEDVGGIKRTVEGIPGQIGKVRDDLVKSMKILFGQNDERITQLETEHAEAEAAKQKAEEEPVVGKETPKVTPEKEIEDVGTDERIKETIRKFQSDLDESMERWKKEFSNPPAPQSPPPPTPPTGPTAKTTAESKPPWWMLVLMMPFAILAVILIVQVGWRFTDPAFWGSSQTATPRVIVVTATPAPESGSVVAPSPSPEAGKAEPTSTSVPAATATEIPATAIATPVPTTPAPAKTGNNLVNPVLFDAGNSPPEEKGGSFDIGVKENQVGVVFGYGIKWDKGGKDLGADGGKLVILRPGWYENLWILDGRYEVYDVPSGDYEGWLKVLGTQRADEQTADYGIVKKQFSDIPQWTSPITSPPK